MIDTTADGLLKEIESADAQRDKVLRDYDEMCRQYAGKPSGINGMSVMPENLTYEYLSFIVPKIIKGQPRVSVTSKRATSALIMGQMTEQLSQMVTTGAIPPEAADEIMAEASRGAMDSDAIEHGVNRWVRDEQYGQTLDRACYHMLKAFAVLKSRLAPAYGADLSDPDSLRWPKSDVVHPKRFLADPTALHISEALWMGDWRPESKQKLKDIAQREEGWRLKDIEELSTETDEETGLQRDFVRVYELWVPDYTEDGWDGPLDGFHGGLFTVGTVNSKGGTKGKFIREPRPYYGPRWGPYALIGAYVRDSSPYPLSPLLATFAQQEELQRHMAAMSRNAAQYKRIVFVSKANTTVINAIKNSPDMFVVPVDDEQFDKDRVISVEVGGVSEQQLKHFELFKGGWDRLAGMEDAQRGAVTGTGTATEHAIADASSTVRIDYMADKFINGVRMDLATKAWYMAHDERVQFRLGPEAGEAFGMGDPYFMGGIDSDSDFTFDELELEIDAYSMQRTNEALLQRRTLEIFNLLLSAAPLMRQYPEIKWKDIWQAIGDAHNMPDVPDVIDFAMIEQMSMMAPQGGEGEGGQSMSVDGFARTQLPGAQQNAASIGQQAAGAVTV